jgi:hypothetical protein
VRNAEKMSSMKFRQSYSANQLQQPPIPLNAAATSRILVVEIDKIIKLKMTCISEKLD